MADRISKEKRSQTMRMIKSSGNKSTEVKMLKYFKNNSIKGWRRNYKLPGHPDFVFPHLRIAVFADGCFWHGHLCRTHIPHTNRDYWKKKIGNNMKRDKIVVEELERKGWKVFRIWECDISKSRYPDGFLEAINF